MEDPNDRAIGPIWKSRNGRFLMLAALTIGGFHLLEHVIQVLQRFVFAMPGGNGIAGSIVDIEPLHFIYNVAYLLLVVGAVLTADRQALDGKTAAKQLLQLTVALQAWHVCEHVVKMIQYVEMGGQNGVGGVFGIGPGALLPLFPIPLLHFGYNLAVYLPFLAAVLMLPRGAASRQRELRLADD